MAILRAAPPPGGLSSSQSTHQNQSSAAAPTTVTNGAIDIDAWTVSALQSLSVSPVARGTGTPLAIPIDEHTPVRHQVRAVALDTPQTPETPRRPPSRRDSQRHREALLKGNEGSRQRRRWENDRLVGVPNVQPPLPSDWEVHPTHPVHCVPYQVAQFWDRGIRERVQEKTVSLQAARKKQQRTTGSATGLGAGEVPRDLRESAKRSPVIRGWVRALEEPVRQFIVGERKRRVDMETARRNDDSAAEEMDSDDEEIVFVGRSGAMRELKEKKEAMYKMARREVEQEIVDSGMVFDSFGDGENAAFKRWLAHSISDYYGLASRSVTKTNSSRVVYVGLPTAHQLTQLPRPLWELC
ncbi:hypothetical protein RJ55_06525 [Drechmeria coniospora]|nr:hypothetical protein RJ55_06525 [Drechmeria coniospora]